MSSIKPNVKYLESLARSYKNMNDMMSETVKLYESRHIKRVETAEKKLIKQLSRKNANTVSIEQKINVYKK